MAEVITNYELRITNGLHVLCFCTGLSILSLTISSARAQPISISLIDSSSAFLQTDSANWNEAWIEVSGAAPASALLSKRDLRVSSGGRTAEIISIDSIAAKYHTRLALSFVLDNSGSMFDSYDTLARYCDSILADQPPGLICQAITFDNRYRNPWELYTAERSTFIAQSFGARFTPDKDSLRKFWHSYDTIRTQFTPLYDAIRAAITNINDRKERDKIPRSDLLLVVTDGIDNASRTSIESLENLLENSRIRLFAINYRVEDEGRLPWLARETGGDYFLAPHPNSLKQILRNIGRSLTREYYVNYRFPSLVPSGSETK